MAVKEKESKSKLERCLWHEETTNDTLVSNCKGCNGYNDGKFPCDTYISMREVIKYYRTLSKEERKE